MNYIKEINSFYDWLETNSVSDSAINLWHGLLHVNNKASKNAEWKEEFPVAISTLQVKTSLSKSSIIRARNLLKQLGRIDFKERKGNQSCIYKIIAFHTDTQSETQSGTQSVTQTDTQSETQSDTINKLNLNKTKPSFEKEAKQKNIQKENLKEQSELFNPEEEEKEKSSAKKEKDKYFSKKDFKKRLMDLGADEQHINDWFVVRDKKRAPYTETALKGLTNECEKNKFSIAEAVRICAERSWQGFKYKWLDENQKQYGKSNNYHSNNGFTTNPGNSTGSQNGKISARTILAQRIGAKATGNNESGNITIDAEVVE